MSRILLATWEGGGNLTPELAIARGLIGRGHSVHVLADSAARAAALAAGCSFSSWQRAPDKASLAPEHDLLRDWEFKNPLALFRHALEVFVAEPQGRYAHDVLDALDGQRCDAVLADFAMLGAMMAAEARRLPCAVVMPNIYMLPAPGIPPLGPGWQPARGPLGRLRDAMLRGLSARIWRRGLPPINRARGELGLPPLTTFWSQHDRADAVFVLTSRAFDFEAERLPDNVHYLGPVLDDPAWADPWTPPWADDDERPLVLVALSSTYQNQVATITSAATALAGLPVRAVVTLGPALPATAVPAPADNVAVVATAPHAAIIPRARLVVTHCGHGTTLKALAAGVPVLCLPMGRDQNDTAARVVARGAGLRLAHGARPRAIARAVRRLLERPAYREGAARLAAAIAAERDAIDVITEVERTLALTRREAAAGEEQA